VKWWPWQDRAWWSGQSRWYFQQPVAHAFGGIAWTFWALLLWWPDGGLKPVLFTLGAALAWQLTLWEPKPDGTYPVRWLVYDVAVEVLTALVVVALW